MKAIDRVVGLSLITNVTTVSLGVVTLAVSWAKLRNLQLPESA